MRKFKFRIKTLSLDFSIDKSKTVLLGFQFSGMNKEDRNKLLGIAFIKDATTDLQWKVQKKSLGPYEEKFVDSDEYLLSIFKPFLYTLEIHLSKKHLHFRKENDKWSLKKKVHHSFEPKFELPLDDLYHQEKKIDYIIKLCDL